MHTKRLKVDNLQAFFQNLVSLSFAIQYIAKNLLGNWIARISIFLLIFSRINILAQKLTYVGLGSASVVEEQKNIAIPRFVIKKKANRNRAYFIFRDEERGSKVSMFVSNNVCSGKWNCYDLTQFSVDSWEPSIDTDAM